MFWSYLSRIYRARALPFYKLLYGNKVLSEQNEITNELYEYYSEQFKEPLIDTSNSHDLGIVNECNAILNTLSNSEEEMERTSVTEIRRLILSLKPKKSAGFDQISNLMIKKLLMSYIECLVVCFNRWLSECRYPEEWKLAKIITLNK